MNVKTLKELVARKQPIASNIPKSVFTVKREYLIKVTLNVVHAGPVVPCRFPCCLEDRNCGKLGPHAHCNVKKPCGAGCGRCEHRHR